MELKLEVESRQKMVRMERSRMVRCVKVMKQTVSFRQPGRSRLLLTDLPGCCDHSHLSGMGPAGDIWAL